MSFRTSHSASFAAVIATVLLAGQQAAAAPPEDPPSSAKPLTVMTRNLYLGASPAVLTTATSPDDFRVKAAAVFNAVKATDFPARAKVLAGEIVDSEATLVALQEASLWRKGEDGIVDGPRTPATIVVYDFLQLLRDALAARGATYDVVVTQQELDAEVPTNLGHDVRLTQRSAILVRAGNAADRATLSNPSSGIFSTTSTIPLPAVGSSIKSRLGWTSVDVDVNGRSFRFINTHLEAVDAAIRTAQAAELTTGPANIALPVVLAGDLNSTPGTPGQGTLIEAGFTDVWALANSEDPGLTCCYGETLRDTGPAALHSRFDYVLTKPAMGVFGVDRIGIDESSLTPDGLWPSDHAGVVARLAPFNAQPAQSDPSPINEKGERP